MGLDRCVGVLLFFAVPLLLWVVLAAITQRGKQRMLSAVVTGRDGRLSLSRLQAFAWTMLIAGAYCAAMAVHPRIGIPSGKETTASEATYTAAVAKVTAAEAAVALKEVEEVSKNGDLSAATEQRNSTTTQLKIANETLQTANDAFDKATKERAAALGDQVKTAQDVLDAKTKAKQEAVAVQEAASKAAETANREHEAAQAAHNLATIALRKERELLTHARGARDTAKASWRATQWVRIPNELLALAGISLATGVFASVISAAGNSTATPLPAPVITKATIYPTTKVLTVSGSGFGDPATNGILPGEVRVDGRAVQPKNWTDTKIDLDLATGAYKTVIVDTAGGKDAFSAQTNGRITVLEWRDLLREDTAPDQFSMTKFQMFAWTIIAVFFYTLIFLSNLGKEIDALPVVDSTLVLLTGLSQGGYLGGKAAAKM
jgi:hypothetical protein